MNGLLRRYCVLPRYTLFPREIFRRDEEDRRRRCRRHRRGGLTKYPAEKIRGTAGVVRELCGLAKGEIDAAWKSLSSGLGGLRARLDDEDAGGLDLPRPREVILHGVRAREGELPQIVVRHRQVRQHEVLHLLGREVFGEAQGVARLWKLLFLVGLLEDRKSTRLNSSHEWISYAVFCLKKKKQRRYSLIGKRKKGKC